MGAYQFKIVIKGSKPPIWRRVVVPQGITFEMLHQIIQAAFCWSGCHLYEFELRARGILVAPDSAYDDFQMPGTISSDTVIDELVADLKKFTYTYDFGDNWEHTIEVEKLLEDECDPWAKVIKYKGDVIPEDCGGIYGYYDLLDTLADPEKLKAYYEENGVDYQEWAVSQGLGAYDLEAVNERLRAMAPSKGAGPESGTLLLADIYHFYDKENILELAKRHGLGGCSRLKKEALIQKTVEFLLSPEEMRRYFLCARDAEIRLFERILAGDNRIAFFEEDDLEYLYAGGYVTEGEQMGLYYAAEDVRQAYEAVGTEEFHAQRSRISRIGDCLCAANALYAVTPVTVVLDLFNTYETKKLTEEELLEAYEKLHDTRPLVELIDGKFVDCVLAEQKTYEELYSRQRQVPYYIPTLREIQFMADNDGFLMGKELEKFGEFLTGELGVEDRAIPFILRDVQSAISVGADLQTVIDELESYGIVFRETAHLEAFTSHIMDVWNNTHMVLNRGYTPFEMVMRGFDQAKETRRSVQKIYPNDPCPCGSGKKYKKCCGKNQ